MRGEAQAWAAAVRSQQRATQNAGYVACLLGVLIMLAGRFVAGAPGFLVYLGLAVILVGWALLTIAIFRRAAYVRAHPFDPND